MSTVVDTAVTYLRLGRSGKARTLLLLIQSTFDTDPGTRKYDVWARYTILWEVGRYYHRQERYQEAERLLLAARANLIVDTLYPSDDRDRFRVLRDLDRVRYDKSVHYSSRLDVRFAAGRTSGLVGKEPRAIFYAYFVESGLVTPPEMKERTLLESPRNRLLSPVSQSNEAKMESSAADAFEALVERIRESVSAHPDLLHHQLQMAASALSPPSCADVASTPTSSRFVELSECSTPSEFEEQRTTTTYPIPTSDRI